MRPKSTDHNLNLWRSVCFLVFGLCARRWRKKKKLPQLRLRCGSKAIFIMRPSRREKTCRDLRSSYQRADLENTALYRCFFLLRSLPATRQSLPHFLCVVLHATTGFLLSLPFSFDFKIRIEILVSLCFAFVFLCPLYRWLRLGGSILPICCAL